MGAGVIPFCVKDGKVWFLFHKTFSGRRAGHLVDFGGGGCEGESSKQTAIREFIEETETMYFSGNISTARLSAQSLQSQTALLEELFDRTLREHPGWWCRRKKSAQGKRGDWITWFVEFQYRDVSVMNREWATDQGRRFRKRRELVWIPAHDLYDLYTEAPEKLWKRVRQLRKARKTIQSIMKAREASSVS